MKLSALRVFVRDLAAARAFYADTLELRLTHDGSQHGDCSFESGGINVIVEAVAADAPGWLATFKDLSDNELQLAQYSA